MGHYLGSTCIDIAIHWSPLSDTKVFQCSIDNRSFSFRVSWHHHFLIQEVVVQKRVSTSAPNLATLSSSIPCHYQPPEVLSGRLVCFHIVVSSLSTPHTPHPTRWGGGFSYRIYIYIYIYVHAMSSSYVHSDLKVFVEAWSSLVLFCRSCNGDSSPTHGFRGGSGEGPHASWVGLHCNPQIGFQA